MIAARDIYDPTKASHFEGLAFSSLVLQSGSMAHMHTNIPREWVSLILEKSGMVLPIHIDFSRVKAALVLAIWDRTSDTVDPKH